VISPPDLRLLVGDKPPYLSHWYSGTYTECIDEKEGCTGVTFLKEKAYKKP